MKKYNLASRISVIRFHNIYGPRMGMSHVIPQLIEKAYKEINNGKLNVYSLEHTRTFCYVADAVEQMYALIMNTKSPEAFRTISEVSRDLKNYELEFRIEELESKFSEDLSEATFNEIRELKKMQKIN